MDSEFIVDKLSYKPEGNHKGCTLNVLLFTCPCVAVLLASRFTYVEHVDVGAVVCCLIHIGYRTLIYDRRNTCTADCGYGDGSKHEIQMQVGRVAVTEGLNVPSFDKE